MITINRIAVGSFSLVLTFLSSALAVNQNISIKLATVNALSLTSVEPIINFGKISIPPNLTTDVTLTIAPGGNTVTATPNTVTQMNSGSVKSAKFNISSNKTGQHSIILKAKVDGNPVATGLTAETTDVDVMQGSNKVGKIKYKINKNFNDSMTYQASGLEIKVGAELVLFHAQQQNLVDGNDQYTISPLVINIDYSI